MQETLFPTSHKLLSPKYVQPVVDKYTALTYQHLEERANDYNGLNVALRNFIVPITFRASSHAFFGQHCPVNDLLEPFKLFDGSFHLLLAGVPKVFMKGPANALDELATVIENYFLKPDAPDDASDVAKEYERIIKEGGFVCRLSHLPLLRILTKTPCRAPEMLPDTPSLSSGPSKQMRRLQRTGSLRSTSNDQTASNH
jgi:hypothetical protein